MSFLTPTELGTVLLPEVIGAITSYNDTITQTAIDAAIGEASTYIANRFDTSILFTNTGPARDPILLQNIKYIAAWHLLQLGNPGIDYAKHYELYNSAIRWFRDIQKMDLTPAGWPVITTQQAVSYFANIGVPPRRY